MNQPVRPAGGNRQRFFDMLVMLATIVPLMLAGLIGAEALVRLGCPPATFLSGPMLPGLRLLGVLMFAVSGGYLISRALFRLFPALTRLTGNPARYGRPSRPGTWARFWLCFSTAWMLIGALAYVAALTSTFCLTPRAIVFREDPWSDEQAYAWGNVTSIATACSRGSRGSWNAVYLLRLQDGPEIDLMASARQFRPAYPALVRALRGQDYAFDASGVAADCDHREADLFRYPPR